MTRTDYHEPPTEPGPSGRSERIAPMTTTWTPTTDRLPDDGTLVEVITPGGDQRSLVYSNGLWFLPDRSMYVYFVPTFWRAA